MKYKKLHIILNEHASSGNSKKRGQKVIDILTKKQIPYTLSITKRPDDGTRLGKEFANSNESSNSLLVVIGGDGTLNQCLNGIRQSKNPNTPISYIPSGSGNDFARGLKLEQHLERIIATITNEVTPKQIDIGNFIDNNSQKNFFFVNNVGIGFDAAIVDATNNSKSKNLLNKLHIGKLSYVSQMVKVFFQQKPFNLHVDDLEANDKTNFTDVFLVTTTNHPFFGGGVPIAPEATPFDEHLDLIVVNKMGMFSLIWLFIKMLTNGSHMNDYRVHHIMSNNLQLRADTFEYKQMDGEDFAKAPIDITFTVEQHPFIIGK